MRPLSTRYAVIEPNSIGAIAEPEVMVPLQLAETGLAIERNQDRVTTPDGHWSVQRS